MLAAAQIEWPATIQLLMGIVGLLSIVALIFTVALQARKLFGKHPPLHEEMKSVREEFRAADQALALSLREEGEKREQQFAELQIERQRTLSHLHKKMNGISRNLYLIAGKLGLNPLASPDEEQV